MLKLVELRGPLTLALLYLELLRPQQPLHNREDSMMSQGNEGAELSSFREDEQLHGPCWEAA